MGEKEADVAGAAAGGDLCMGAAGGDLRTGAAAAMGDTKTRTEGWGHTAMENSGAAREDGRSSPPPDEASDRIASDVGDEERGMRHPHPVGAR